MADSAFVFFAVLFGAPFAILIILGIGIMIGLAAMGIGLGYFECVKFHTQFIYEWRQKCLEQNRQYSEQKTYGTINASNKLSV